MADPEQGIAQAQIEAARRQGADGLAEHQQRNITYLNERIVLFLCCLGILGVFVVWVAGSMPPPTELQVTLASDPKPVVSS